MPPNPEIERRRKKMERALAHIGGTKGPGKGKKGVKHVSKQGQSRNSKQNRPAFFGPGTRGSIIE